MKQFIRKNIEYILLVSLYFWVGYCSIFNMGVLASIVFVLLVTVIGFVSLRASFCVMLSLLFCSMSSLNMPSPIIISSIIIFILNAKRIKTGGKSLAFSKVIFPFVLYFFIRIISCLYVVDEELYFDALTVDFITVISLFLAVLLIRNVCDVEFVERWIGILGILATCLGFSYFLFNDTAYLGQLYAGTGFAGKGVIGDDFIKAWLRWVPIDKEPNFWAAYLLFPYGYWLHVVSKKVTTISMLGLIVTYSGILFSYSRSSFLVSSFVLFFVLFRSRKKYFLGITIAFVLIFIGISIYSPDIINRIVSINDNITSEGGSGRFELWGEAINNLARNPLIGIGTGQTPAYSATHMGTHNLYLQILGENGVLGFSVFLYLWIAAFVGMKRYMKQNDFYYFAFLGFSVNLMTVHCFDLRIPLFIVLLYYISFQSSLQSRLKYTIKNS